MSCIGPENISLTDPFTISTVSTAVPEFSDYAILLILIVAVGGFLGIKQKV